MVTPFNTQACFSPLLMKLNILKIEFAGDLFFSRSWWFFFRTRDQIALTFVTKPKNSDVIDQVADQVIPNSTALPFKFNLEIHAAKKGTTKLLTHSNSTQNVRYLCIIQIQYFLVNCDTYLWPPVTEVFVQFFEILKIFLSFSQHIFIIWTKIWKPKYEESRGERFTSTI